MLDETTCPVCGKVLWSDDWADDMFPQYGSWAVAHYLAHLVQQGQPQVNLDPPSEGR